MRILIGIFSGLADQFGRAQWWCFGVAARVADRMESNVDSRHEWEHFQQLTGWSKEEIEDLKNSRKKQA